jgi:hypothetical protein
MLTAIFFLYEIVPKSNSGLQKEWKMPRALAAPGGTRSHQPATRRRRPIIYTSSVYRQVARCFLSKIPASSWRRANQNHEPFSLGTPGARASSPRDETPDISWRGWQRRFTRTSTSISRGMCARGCVYVCAWVCVWDRASHYIDDGLGLYKGHGETGI